MIVQTIEKQDGHEPYLWAVVWKDKQSGQQNVSVFSFWEDARERCEAFQANGHEAQIDLAVDNTRKVVKHPTELERLDKAMCVHPEDEVTYD